MHFEFTIPDSPRYYNSYTFNACYLTCYLLFRMPPPAAQNPMSYQGSSSGLSSNYLNALQHQEYLTAAAQRLGELQASAGLVDPLALEGMKQFGRYLCY